MTKQEKANLVMEILKKEYPTVETPLIHKNAFELLAATMLSAQTLDATTNTVTPILFAKYSTAQKMSQANPDDIAKIIRVVNYNKTKSRNLVNMSKMLLEQFDGIVPSTIDELILLPGVGRKTANVVISEWFAKSNKTLPEGFVVDTHVKRVAKRLGLTKNDDPVKVEQDLMKLFPREEWAEMSLRFIFHGRNKCKAQNPKCKYDPVWRELCNCWKEK